ncbi:hypothetical protein JST97_31775 [bacterium]|nr:hypothetical protein [bacterium]
MSTTFYILTRRLRPQDIAWLSRSEEPNLVVFGQGLLSDFSPIKEKTTVFALQEEVKETGLVPQYEGKLELKNGGDLVELLLDAQLVHL